MLLKEFLELDYPEKYNFEFENKLLLDKKSDTYSRYFIYKASSDSARNSSYENGRSFAEKVIEKYGYLADCDGTLKTNEKDTCMLSRYIYRTLWGWNDVVDKILKRYGQVSFNEFGIMGPDTMNSAQTIVNGIIKEAYKKCEDEKIINLRKGHMSANFMLELFFVFYSNKALRKWLDDVKGLEDFLDIYHTIGNFILVPSHFNPMRGIDSEIKDYWDLSLNYLKEKENFYYQGIKINWQNSLFKRYINTFFLWDYCYIPIDKKNEGKYMVKSLLSSNFKDIKYNEMNHTDSHSMYRSEEKEEISDFLENVNWAIERRGIFMVAMLKITLLGRDEKNNNSCEWNVSPIYKKIMETVFQKEDCYESYAAVFSKIVEILNQEEKRAIKDIVLSAAEKLVCKEDLERIQKLF